MEWAVGIFTGLLGAVVGGLSAGVPLYLKLRKGTSDIRREERDTVIEEHVNLIARLRETIQEMGIELKGARIDLINERKYHDGTKEEKHDCLQHKERADERMDYLEELLRGAKVPFRERQQDDSKAHRPLQIQRKPPHPTPEGSDI